MASTAVKATGGVAGAGAVGGTLFAVIELYRMHLDSEEKAASLLAMGLDKAEKCGYLSSALETCMEVLKVCGQ